jgi:hypothetical protein
MQIFVRDLEGRHVALDVSSDETIDSLKAKIQGKTGVAPAQQLLTYGGKALTRGNLLDYSIQKDCTIQLTLGLPGGNSWDRQILP